MLVKGKEIILRHSSTMNDGWSDGKILRVHFFRSMGEHVTRIHTTPCMC
jgi:hypothetical protein